MKAQFLATKITVYSRGFPRQSFQCPLRMLLARSYDKEIETKEVDYEAKIS